MIPVRSTSFFICCCIGIAAFHVQGALAAGTKVDVCHIPPGNPENVHTITISESAVDTHLEHGDHLGACDPTQVRDGGASGTSSQSACICPRAGVWRVTNHEGWMECNVLGIKRKVKRPDKNDGASWILNDN